MALAPGTRVGPYEIAEPIGEGGMGEVYRATDTNLGRYVAIKVLPDAFAQDAERLARFEREARTLASLNHPAIATIHGLEKSGDVRALVMELVEGPTLADRIAAGAIPLDEALPIAKQIAEALEAAHERGIVHRDLKPANVKVRPDGAVKVLDFGLAKAMEPVTALSPGRSMAATITTPAMTQIGVILGTAAYMSPEQAKGRPTDKRGDIWAYGCVLFEMLTAKRAFDGEDVSDTLAAVLRQDLDFTALPASTPAPIKRLLRRCLARDPSERLHDIADARLEIADARVTDPDRAPATVATHRLSWILTAALGALCLVLAVLLQRSSRPPAVSTAVYRSVILPPAVDTSLAGSEARAGLPRFARGVALSPDGGRLAFVAPGPDGRVMLWIRRLDDTTAQVLPGTEGAASPFWSAKGDSLAFAADRKLKIVDATGGSVSTLYDGVGQVAQGTWNRDNVILFAGANGKMFRISGAGGAAYPLAGIDASLAPAFLPDGRRFLYSAASSGGGTRGGIYVGSLDSNERINLRDDGFLGTYANGVLLFVRDNVLMGQRFDPVSLKLTSDPVPVAQDIRLGGPASSRTGFSVSETGVLVYQPALTQQSQLTWMDRGGRTIGVLSEPRDFTYVNLSPDDRHVVVSRMDETWMNRDVWLFDTTRKVQIRLTDEPSDDFAAVWSPTGDRIVFAGRRAADQSLDLYEKPSSGTGDERRLLEHDGLEIPTSWSADGQFILFQTQAPASDIFVLRLQDSKVLPFANSRHTEASAQFSTDGRWVAYSSDQSGRTEVYVAPFQRAGPIEPISTDGGGSPRWGNGGKELFYIRPDNMLMAVTLRLGESSIDVGQTRELFRTQFRNAALPYAVARDGRFLVNRAMDDATPTPITLVVNWPALLEKPVSAPAAARP